MNDDFDFDLLSFELYYISANRVLQILANFWPKKASPSKIIVVSVCHLHSVPITFYDDDASSV